MKSYDKLVKQLKKEIEKRYAGKPLARHIHSVAEFARQIAENMSSQNGALARKAYLAGLAHDLYKKYSEKDLRQVIREEAVPIDEDSWNFGGGLLHAAAAAHYLRVRCGVTDNEIIAAVYYHTTSRAASSTLEKILFCADYLDPSREVRSADPDVEVLSKKVLTDLDGVYREVLRRKLVYTVTRGKPLHPSGSAAWNEVVRGE
ncbi:MAG TPA: bis(5'-nucleosyl)-tetraphosphatase (symmetrical) YqeK [Candidatus Glassbacteria bacterium]|nr:bis(5'-nucleosyl)-tetraphosphatase (symmetrical) YqeK [Candidatus Glassbacteria bacterium]